MNRKIRTGLRHTAVFWRLFRMYVSLVLGINRLAEFIKDTRGKAGGHTGRDGRRGAGGTAFRPPNDDISIVKTGLFALLLIYIGGCFIVFFGSITVNLYKVFQPLGMMQELFELEMLLLCVFLLMTNFLLTLSTYSIGGVETTLRAMPIPPAVFFGAKYLAHCIPAMLFSLAFFSTAAAVYGFYEQQSFVFYAAAVLGALFFPLPLIGFCYLVHILLMRSTAVLKNKQLIMVLGSGIGIALAVGINAFVHWSRDTAEVQAALVEYRQGAAGKLTAVLPMRFFAQSLAASSLTERLGFLLLFIVICSALAAALVFLFSGIYVKTLDGFDEKKLKKLSVSERRRLFGGKVVQRPLWFALLLREIRMMNREPAYLLNGPFMIIFFPLIVAIMYFTGSADVPAAVSGLLQGSRGVLLSGVCGAFLGSATNIAATAVSRDAQNISFLKSLPVPAAAYMQAKLAHAMLVALLGVLIGTGGTAYLLSLQAAEIAAAVSIALSLAFFCNLLALMLDTAHPKLSWSTPAAAIKQNLNALVMMFTDMILLSITAVIAVLVSLPPYLCALWFAGIPLVLSCTLLHFFLPDAERRITHIEP